MSDDDNKDKKQNEPCTYTLDDGTVYDLSSLSSSSEDYQAASGDSGPKYGLNVCRSVLTELSHIDEPPKVGGFSERADGKGHFSIGEFSTNITLSPGTNDPLLIYQHGSPCPGNDKELASTAIRFVCSPSDFGAGSPQLIASLPAGPDACHFFFEWKTHVACAGASRGSDHGMVITFVSFILIAVLTWFGGHTAYNRFFLGRRGMEQFPVCIPHCSAPKLRLPGSSSRGDSAQSERPAARGWGFGRSQRHGRNGYSHLRQDPDEEDALAGARFSLDDDEDLDADVDHDARALGGEVDAWRQTGTPRRSSEDAAPRLGAHQGLVDI